MLLGLALMTVGCELEESESLGESQLAVSGLTPILDHAPSLGPIANLSTAWVPTANLSAGHIVSAFTVNPNTPQSAAAYSYMPGPDWFTAQSSPVPGQIAAQWNQGSVWPVPWNLCDVDVHDCGSPTFDKYYAAPAILSTGDDDVAAIVATTLVLEGNVGYTHGAVVTFGAASRAMRRAFPPRPRDSRGLASGSRSCSSA